jgi:hypothetical protein
LPLGSASLGSISLLTSGYSSFISLILSEGCGS